MVIAGAAGQTPTSFHGFPPFRLMLVESLNFSVVAVGAEVELIQGKEAAAAETAAETPPGPRPRNRQNR